MRVQTAAHEIGNGVYTVLAQLAAERLGVPLKSVTVEVGDTLSPNYCSEHGQITSE